MKHITEFLNKNLYKFIVLFILVLASLIYIYKIDLLSLDCDEIFTINIINLPSLQEVVYEGNIRDTHPPLYHVLLFFFVKIFGHTEFVIRLFSSFCGILSTFFIFILAKKLFSIKEGIISAFIAVFNIYLLYINQWARGYALFLLLSILTFIFLVNIIKKTSKDGFFPVTDSILYAFFSILNIYTHYFAILLLSTQLLFILFFYGKKSIKYLLFLSVTIFLCYFPWIFFIEKKGVNTFNINYLEWLNHCVFFNSKYKLVFAFFLMFPVLLIVFNKILKKKDLKKIVEDFRYEIFLLFFCIIPYFLLFFIDKCLFNCYAERYIVFLIPIYIVFISRGITLLFRNFIILVSFVSLIVFVLSFNMLDFKVHNFTGFYCQKPREAMHCISKIYESNKNKNIEIVLIGVHFFDFYISKYLGNVDKDKINIIDWRKCNVDNNIIELLEQKRPEYVLTVQSCHTNYLQNNFAVVFYEYFNNFDVYLIKTNKE